MARTRLALTYEPKRLPAAFPFQAIPWRLGDNWEGWDRHRHEIFEIGCCHAGTGSFIIEDKTFRFQPGSVVVISHRDLHRAYADTGTVSDWTFLFFDPVRLLAGLTAEDSSALATNSLTGPAFTNILDPVQHPAACALAMDLAKASEDHGPHQHALIRGLVLALMARLNRLPGRRSHAGTDAGDLERLAPALRLIAARYTGTLPMSALARACGIGESALRARFTAAFGHGPREHLIRYRLQQAAQRLRVGETVTDAALTSGFMSLSAFHRHFRAAYGQSPAAWKRQD